MYFQVQSKQEKKPGRSSPVPLNSVVSPCALPVNKATSSTPLSINIPRFYFPKGLPNVCTNHEEIIARIEEAFTEFEDEKANICEMGKIAKVDFCRFLYWKRRKAETRANKIPFSSPPPPLFFFVKNKPKFFCSDFFFLLD